MKHKNNIIIFGIILLFLLLGIYSIKTFKSSNVIFKMNYTQEIDTWYTYLYETSHVEYVNFCATYSDGNSTYTENLGNYYLNNRFNIFDIFSNTDKGKIKIKIDTKENGFYIDCYSNIGNSNEVTLPSNEIFSYLPYSSLTFTAKQQKVNDYTFLIMQGENKINSNKINVYMTIGD